MINPLTVITRLRHSLAGTASRTQGTASGSNLEPEPRLDFDALLPGIGLAGLVDLLEEGQWHVVHGTIDRYPEFLQPNEGAISSIEKLKNWPRFHFAYRDAAGRYLQTDGKGASVRHHYDRGALIHSHSIHEKSGAARAWSAKWAAALGVLSSDLHLNSWAVKGTGGIGWHFDVEDVIHFQIAGDKLFKLLRTPNTRFADLQTKRFERVQLAQAPLAEISEHIVRAGTITVIPRGVWHWSEGKSKESFAVSLCVNPPSRAQILTRTLLRHLRLIERNRMPAIGDEASQCVAMEACLQDAMTVLQTIDHRNVLAEERRLEFPIDAIDSLYFYLGRLANARLEPLAVRVNERPFPLPSDEQELAVMTAICKRAEGFRAGDLSSLVPQAPPHLINQMLASLVRIGFIDFVADLSPPHTGVFHGRQDGSCTISQENKSRNDRTTWMSMPSGTPRGE